MRSARDNNNYAAQVTRKHHYPGWHEAQLYGASEPVIIQQLRLIVGWETVYPDGANASTDYPLMFDTVNEARAAGIPGVTRIVGYHTGTRYG